jgi:hypothetical protein
VDDPASPPVCTSCPYAGDIADKVNEQLAKSANVRIVVPSELPPSGRCLFCRLLVPWSDRDVNIVRYPLVADAAIIHAPGRASSNGAKKM